MWLFLGVMIIINIGLFILPDLIWYLEGKELKEAVEKARGQYEGRTWAQVVELRKEGVRNSFITYWPVFLYEANGAEYRKEGTIFSDKAEDYLCGTNCEIRYNAGNPEEFMVAEDKRCYDCAVRRLREGKINLEWKCGCIVLIAVYVFWKIR